MVIAGAGRTRYLLRAIKGSYAPQQLTAGQRIRRNIIHTFVASYNGTEIFRAELHLAMSVNPFLTFQTIATESGTIDFRWIGDNGYKAAEQAKIMVMIPACWHQTASVPESEVRLILQHPLSELRIRKDTSDSMILVWFGSEVRFPDSW
ncbi:MAG: hypothetical protein GEU91_02875 [Rhizobiales bacterium]|nr:hypothetical protein [Hyphomicrobiales bacterium]